MEPRGGLCVGCRSEEGISETRSACLSFRTQSLGTETKVMSRIVETHLQSSKIIAMFQRQALWLLSRDWLGVERKVRVHQVATRCERMRLSFTRNNHFQFPKFVTASMATVFNHYAACGYGTQTRSPSCAPQCRDAITQSFQRSHEVIAVGVDEPLM